LLRPINAYCKYGSSLWVVQVGNAYGPLHTVGDKIAAVCFFDVNSTTSHKLLIFALLLNKELYDMLLWHKKSYLKHVM